MDQTYFEKVHDLIRQNEKALNGYMAYVRKQHFGEETNGTRALREEDPEYNFELDSSPTLGSRSA